jgi:predicted nuclease of predicted toxin-antitoxin system
MLNIILDMNLSPELADVLVREGYNAVHWSSVGKIDALDSEIFEYAIRNDYVVFTHDLDFGIMLALTKSSKPSVIQVRTQNMYSKWFISEILAVLKEFKDELLQGSILTIDENKSRIRILPIE